MALGLSSGAWGFNVFVAPILSSLAWFSGGAALVEITAPTTVPLVHEPDDPRPRQQVSVGARRVQALIDLTSPHSRVGRLWAIRLGLETQRRRGRERAIIDELRFGDVVLRDLRVEVVADDDVVLGVQGLEELAVAVQPSAGVVHWVRAGDGQALLESVGEVQREPASWTTGLRRSRTPDGPVQWHLGEAWVHTTPSIAEQALAPLWMPAAPGPARLGADALVHADIAVWPAEDAWAGAPRGVALLDEAVRHRDQLEADAVGWDAPPPYDAEATPLEGAPGSGWRSDRAEALAAARWATGDLVGSIEASIDAVGWGEDRCGPWVALGERLLRAHHDEALGRAVRGVPLSAVDVLDNARRLLIAWEEQPPDRRGVDGFAVRQPEACRAVHGLLAEARLVAGEADPFARTAHPAARVVRALHDLRMDRPVEAIAELTTSIADAPSPDPVRDALLGLAQARAGRTSIARDAVCGGPREGLALASLRASVAATISPADNGVTALQSCPMASPGHQVMQRLHGDELADTPGAVDVARRPRVAGATAPVSLATELWGGPDVPAPAPSPDAAVARLLAAHARSDGDAVDQALHELCTRWPLYAPWPSCVTDPGPPE